MINLDDIKFRGLQETGIPYHLQTDQPIQPTVNCPSCGRLVRVSDCNYSRILKTFYGGYVLQGVCKECSDSQKEIKIISKIESKTKDSFHYFDSKTEPSA